MVLSVKKLSDIKRDLSPKARKIAEETKEKVIRENKLIRKNKVKKHER